MNTKRFSIRSHLLASLFLGAAIFFSLGPPALLAQTSETSATGSASPAAKDAAKAKHATDSYSVDTVPEHVSATSRRAAAPNNDQVKALQEKVRRLETENAQLKAELATLKDKE